MLKSELISKLKGMDIPEDSYSIEEVLNESLCLICEDKIWKVFYSERGHRVDERRYFNERDACQYFILRLTHVLGV